MKLRCASAVAALAILVACGGGAGGAPNADGARPAFSSAAGAPSSGVTLQAVVPMVNVAMAHRGYSSKAPENTFASFTAAVAAGAKWVETDARLTKDGHLALIHDVNLQRTTDAMVRFPERSPWNANTFTLAEIKQLDAGSWFNAKFAGEPVLTLEELLNYLKGRDVGLHLEMKTSGETASKVSEALVNSGWIVSGVPTQRLIVTSFDSQHLRVFKKLQPTVELSVNLSYAPTSESLKALEEVVHGFAIPVDAINDPILTSGTSPLLSRVGVYTVNNITDMDKVLARRFAYLFTDYIELLNDRIAKQP